MNDLPKVNKVWGEEQIIINEEYCGKILVINRRGKCSLHQHLKKKETFYILSGLIKMEMASRILIMHPGSQITIHPGSYHSFTGIEDSQVLEISTHHRDDDSYRDPKALSTQITEQHLEEIINKYGIYK